MPTTQLMDRELMPRNKATNADIIMIEIKYTKI